MEFSDNLSKRRLRRSCEDRGLKKLATGDPGGLFSGACRFLQMRGYRQIRSQGGGVEITEPGTGAAFEIRTVAAETGVRSNEFRHETVEAPMKAILPLLATSLILSVVSPAQTCREVVRDSSGRVVQTKETRKSGSGTTSVTRDASGRVIGTATSQTNGSVTRTDYRDASGRMTGSANTKGSSAASSQTTYRDASGRVAGSATSRANGTSGSRTDFRDATGRSAGSQTSNGSSGPVTGTSRDTSGRVIASSTGSGKCPSVVRVPVPPADVKK
jgi:hypothetical protein